MKKVLKRIKVSKLLETLGTYPIILFWCNFPQDRSIIENFFLVCSETI